MCWKTQRLPMAGGYDREGEADDDPAAILETRRTLPMELLERFRALPGPGPSGGHPVRGSNHEDGGRTSYETDLSQIFLAVSLDSFPDRENLLAISPILLGISIPHRNRVPAKMSVTPVKG